MARKLWRGMVGKDAKCLVCGSKVMAELDNVFDTRFGIENVWDICRCTDCGIEQTFPIPSPGELKELYGEYYNFGGEKGTRYTRLRKRLLRSLFYRILLAIDGDISFHSYRGSGLLLDIGCNEGRGLQIYQRNGYDAEGLELNEQAAEQARSEGFRVTTVLLKDFHPKEPFDVVVLSNVLEHSPNPSLTFFNFPEEEWISLRTTNVIERLNKEFKRRTKPMEIVAGENACYMLLAFVSIKMELHWRSNPIGKVRNNLPFLKELANNNFTQKT